MAATQTDTRQTVRAEAKWVRCSARKARIVLDHIRGQSVQQAATTLHFMPRAAARDIERVLRSAVANAQSRDDLRWDAEDLIVFAAYANEGPTLKRWRARARGRVNRIRKRTCHITVVVAQDPRAVEARASAPAQAEPRRRGRRRAEDPAAAETAAPEETAAAGEESTPADVPVPSELPFPTPDDVPGEAPAEPLPSTHPDEIPHVEPLEPESAAPEAAAPAAAAPEATEAEASGPVAEGEAPTEAPAEEKPKRTRRKKKEADE
jgi:large subunit ribosomal protein L22